VRGAKQREFDLQAKKWTIPAERTKMRRDHIIPLSDQALELVEIHWIDIEGVELIFPSISSNRKWLSENAFNSECLTGNYLLIIRNSQATRV